MHRIITATSAHLFTLRVVLLSFKIFVSIWSRLCASERPCALPRSSLWSGLIWCNLNSLQQSTVFNHSTINFASCWEAEEVVGKKTPWSSVASWSLIHVKGVERVKKKVEGLNERVIFIITIIVVVVVVTFVHSSMDFFLCAKLLEGSSTQRG